MPIYSAENQKKTSTKLWNKKTDYETGLTQQVNIVSIFADNLFTDFAK